MVVALRFSAVCVLLAALTACGSGPRHPINPPNSSVQQLDVLPDGRWKLQVRVENFSDKTVHYGTLKAALHVGGVAAADLTLKTEIDIPGEKADVVEATVSPTPEAQKAFAIDIKEPGGAGYELKGTIDIPSAKEFKFEHKSRLSPVPGIPNEYR